MLSERRKKWYFDDFARVTYCDIIIVDKKYSFGTETVEARISSDKDVFMTWKTLFSFQLFFECSSNTYKHNLNDIKFFV